MSELRLEDTPQAIVDAVENALEEFGHNVTGDCSHYVAYEAWRALLGGGPPLEPSEEATEAAFNETRGWKPTPHWNEVSRILRAAYAIDGLRAVPSQESGSRTVEDDASTTQQVFGGKVYVPLDQYQLALSRATDSALTNWELLERAQLAEEKLLRYERGASPSGRGDPQKGEA